MANVVCSPARTVRFIHQLVVALIAICSLAATASAQTTVTLSTPGTHINADLTIQGGASGWTDFSNSDSIATKVSSADYTRRIMLKFDTENFIPANAVIQSAQLYLVLKSAESNESRPLTAFQVGSSFVKGETNWYYFRYGQAWASPGGDLTGNYGTTYVGGAVGSAYSFDLKNLVQRTVNGQFGSRYTRLALVDTGGNSTGNFRSFHSTRAANASLRPRLIITYTTSQPTATPPPPPAPAPSGGATLRVMQWNMHKTIGSDGACNPDRTANTIVAQRPDVVSLNEVNFFSGNCAYSFDMGLKLQTLLQQKTGVTWYRQFVNPSGVGNVILSRYPLVSASSTYLSYNRGVAQIGIVVNGRNVNLFSTHIEYVNAPWRPIQIAEAARWLANFSEPRIFMGDFNTWPNTNDYYLVANLLQDAWPAAQNAGTASAFNGTGATEGDSRLDYVFYSRVAALALQSVTIPDTRVGSVWPSDHSPVVAVFTVR